MRLTLRCCLLRPPTANRLSIRPQTVNCEP